MACFGHFRQKYIRARPSPIGALVKDDEYRNSGYGPEIPRYIVLDAQTQNGDEPIGENSYPGAKLPF